MARCPSCKNDAKPREENPSFPFCSPRCRAVDLGRWFTGEYRVAGERLSSETKAPAAEPDSEKH